MKSILLSVVGLSPQVVTETLYALKNSESFPDEIHIVGTGEGIRRAKLELLTEGRGQIEKLCAEYDLPMPSLPAENFHCVVDEQGSALQDMLTEQDHEQTSDLLFDVIRDLVIDDNSALHISMAGGRKTMGFYAGYILSLVGRQQDRLSHVIVDADFEGHPDFFFPPKTQTVIHHRQTNKPVDAATANVTLAYIPIVRMSALLSDSVIQQAQGFTDLVERTQPFIDQLNIEADFESLSLKINQFSVRFDRLNFVWYVWLLSRQLADKDVLGPLSKTDDYKALNEEFAWFYNELVGEFGADDRTLSVFESAIDDKFVRERQSRVNKALAVALGERKAGQLSIVNTGKRGARTIELTVHACQVLSISLQRTAKLISTYQG